MQPDHVQELLAALSARIETCVEHGDASGVLEASALDEAGELWLALQLQPEPQLEALYILAFLHWCRYQALPEGLDHEDGAAALRFFEMVGRTRPDLVPPDVARVLGTSAPPRGGPGEDPASVFNRGVLLFNEFRATGQRPAIDQALALFHQAANRIPPGHPRRGMALAGIGAAYTVRFDVFGDTQDLEEAISWGNEAVRATPAGHDDRPNALTKVGMAYLTRYERSGNAADLEKAIGFCAEAAQHAAGHPRGADLLSNAGLTYRARFELRGADADLAELVRHAEGARRAADADDGGFAETLANLAGAYQIRFSRLGNRVDLNRALDYWQQAERATVSELNHPRMLSSLGLAFRMKFEQTGADADLDKAIRYSVQAVNESPETHITHAGVLSNCSVAYKIRFERLHDGADLQESLRYARRAVEATPDGHPERAKFLGGLVGIYFFLFQETRRTAYLDDAVGLGNEVLEAMPSAHASRGMALSDLGLAYQARFEQNKSPQDLELAIRYGRDAVEATPLDHPERAMRMCGLSVSYRLRYELSGAQRDGDHALSYAKAAVETTPRDHPQRAMFLSSLAAAYRAQSRQGMPGALGQAIICWREAASSPVASADERITAAIAWGMACETMADPASAAEGFAEAVRLLPLQAWRGLERRVREKHLAEVGGLVTDAAGWAIEAGNLEKAVELLEQGRSVLWSQSLHLRTDLTRVRQADEDLASRLEEVRAALNRPPAVFGALQAAAGEAQQNAEVVASRQRELAREWDELVRQVRNLPEMDTFLAATPFRRLCAAASGGPVVMVNVGNRRCDALIITKAGVRLRPLPSLTAEECSRLANTLLDVLDAPTASADSPGAPRRQLNSVLFGIMSWLWDTVCEPVLKDLRDHGDLPDDRLAESGSLPRLWWCPTGPLTGLPLHAAGHYADSDGPYLSQVAVSSYTPTVEALLRSRKRAQASTGPQILAVGMPTTPGFGDLQFTDLPGVPEELACLAEALPGASLQVLRSPTRDELINGTVTPQETQPTADRVTRALPSFPWVHFACHGGQDLLDPSRGALYLTDGPLTVLQLAADELPAAELAFLSACQTAVGGAQVPDETIHLAAALQFAGYRHIIATAWSISDNDAPQVASAVYTALAATGSLEASRAASAVHRAVAALRTDKPRRPDLWAPYLHIGP